MMESVEILSLMIGVIASCAALGVVRATFYRWRKAKDATPVQTERKPSERALSDEERQEVLDTLNSERFVDHSPPQVFAALLEERTYLCSIRTMYRILEDNAMVRERRNQRRHPEYKKPELLADGPRQLWSWDITKLKGPTKGSYFYLYVLLDVFSRYVVGWMVAPKESAKLGQKLIEESFTKQQISPASLTIHSDRGAPMTAKSTALLLAELGVAKSHSRPHVSNDNPFSESQFKTLKYRPEFPERFGSIQDARAHCREFFQWYNERHYHSSLALFTPADVHYERVEEHARGRQEALDAAFARHPERFVNKHPSVSRPPTQVWINPPSKPTEESSDEPEVVVPFHSPSPSLPASPAPHESAFTGPPVGSWGAGDAELDDAYARHPERFVHKVPNVSRPPTKIWINPPTQRASDSSPESNDTLSGLEPLEPSQRVQAQDFKTSDELFPQLVALSISLVEKTSVEEGESTI